MKTHFTLAALVLGLAVGAMHAPIHGQEPSSPSPEGAKGKKIQTTADLTTSQQKASYAIGTTIGLNLKSQGVEMDLEALTKGILDSFTGEKLLLSDQEIQEVFRALTAELMEKRAAIAEQKRKGGEAFLATNKEKPGVITLQSGLQYKVLKEGTGPKPKASDKVTTHYRGTLVDGTVFDSSYDRGEPASFQVGGVIPGWTEALQLMPVGSKWQLFVPLALAYGERGSPPRIAPHETLIFEVELLSID